MAKHGMTFNGVKKDYVVTLRGKRRPPWAPLQREFVNVPGLPGAYLNKTEIEPRPLDVPILIESKNLDELQDMKEDLANWLVTKEAKELIFDDEPDRVYYAMVDGKLDIDEIVRVGVGMLYLKCADPFKYGEEDILVPNATDLTQPVLLDVQGTEETPATFDVELKAPTTHLDIVGDKSYMRLGRAVNEDTYAAPKYNRILWDEFADISQWNYDTTFNLDGTGNSPSGTITSNGYSIRIGDKGTGTGWHGPAIIKEIDPLQDFKIRLRLQLMNPKRGTMGRIELYLLDEYKRVVGKVSLRERTPTRDGNYIEARAGDARDGDHRHLINGRGDKWWAWLNFDGFIELIRNENDWVGYASKIGDDGNYHTQSYRTWKDLSTIHSNPVKYIMIHMAGYNEYPVSPMNVQDLKVWSINTLAGDAVPYIGDDGDIFTFDMKRSLILKNGEPYKKKDFGSRFFNLEPGLNSLLFSPPEAIDNVGAKWRSRYK